MSELEVMAYICAGLFVSAFFIILAMVTTLFVIDLRESKAMRHYSALAQEARYEKIRKKELEAQRMKDDEFFKEYERYFNGV